MTFIDNPRIHLQLREPFEFNYAQHTKQHEEQIQQQNKQQLQLKKRNEQQENGIADDALQENDRGSDNDQQVKVPKRRSRALDQEDEYDYDDPFLDEDDDQTLHPESVKETLKGRWFVVQGASGTQTEERKCLEKCKAMKTYSG